MTGKQHTAICKGSRFHWGVLKEHAASSCRVDMNVNIKTKQHIPPLASTGQIARYLRPPHPEYLQLFKRKVLNERVFCTQGARPDSGWWPQRWTVLSIDRVYARGILVVLTRKRPRKTINTKYFGLLHQPVKWLGNGNSILRKEKFLRYKILPAFENHSSPIKKLLETLPATCKAAGVRNLPQILQWGLQCTEL
jgi:hypothetical protein